MKISCPYCKEMFDVKNQIIKPAKEHYKWYEITTSHTFCPACNQRYQSDISPLGILFVAMVMALLFVGIYTDNSILVILAIILTGVFINLFQKILISVKQK